MRRRSLLRALAGGAAVAVVGDAPFAEAQSRRPLLGFSCYGMKTLPVSEAINHIAKIGYKGVELSLIPGFETDPTQMNKAKRAAIRKQIGALGLTLSSVQDCLQLAEPNAMTKLGYDIDYSQAENLERIRMAAAMAHELPPGAPAVIESPVGGTAGTWEQVKRGMADRLGEWAKALESLKTVLAIKGFVGTPMDTPEKMLWILEQVNNSPWIRVGYDYAHFKLLGLDMRKTIMQLGSRTAFIHVKDSVGTAEKFRFMLPGDSGEINYKEYAQALRDVGYHGPVVVEVSAHVSSQPGYDPVEGAKHSWENLSPFFD
jgi:sugar phosphate isomerase/epimerase